jgi:hypothetical protein
MSVHLFPHFFTPRSADFGFLIKTSRQCSY